MSMVIKNKFSKFWILFFIFFFLSCTSRKTKDLTIKFEDEIHDFGKLKKGEDVSCFFKFYNIGKKTMKLQYVISSCGCTVSEWSKKVIEPQGRDSIKVKYSADDLGIINQMITVFYDDNDPPKHLFIKGTVISN